MKEIGTGHSEERGAGNDDVNDAAAESARRQEGLERRTNGLHNALCRPYVGLDELLSYDFAVQWHP